MVAMNEGCLRRDGVRRRRRSGDVGVKVISVAIVERLWPLTIRTARKEGDHNDEIVMRGLEQQRNLK